MSEIRIKSLQQFVEQITNLELAKNHTRFFRGHPDKKYLLEPSIYRLDKNTGKKVVIHSEHLIVKDVLTECAEYFSPHDSLFDKLVKMQHYDYPTRLLDVSYNALVGLYFAVNKNYGENKKQINCQKCNQIDIIDDDKTDGEVIIFDMPNEQIKHHDSDTVAILSAISLQDNDFDAVILNIISEYNMHRELSLRLKSESEIIEFLKNNNHCLYKKFSYIVKEIDKLPKDETININKYIITNAYNSQQHIISLLNDVRKDKPYFLPNIDRNSFNQVVFVKPKLNNPRISKQQGAFLLFGIDGQKENQSVVNNDWIISKGEKRLIIDKAAKPRILDELKSFGVSHQTLFPELDAQANHIINRHR